jgi:hypothetical protein
MVRRRSTTVISLCCVAGRRGRRCWGWAAGCYQTTLSIIFRTFLTITIARARYSFKKTHCWTRWSVCLANRCVRRRQWKEVEKSPRKKNSLSEMFRLLSLRLLPFYDRKMSSGLFHKVVPQVLVFTSPLLIFLRWAGLAKEITDTCTDLFHYNKAVIKFWYHIELSSFACLFQTGLVQAKWSMNHLRKSGTIRIVIDARCLNAESSGCYLRPTSHTKCSKFLYMHREIADILPCRLINTQLQQGDENNNSVALQLPYKNHERPWTKADTSWVTSRNIEKLLQPLHLDLISLAEFLSCLLEEALTV